METQRTIALEIIKRAEIFGKFNEKTVPGEFDTPRTYWKQEGGGKQ